MKNKKERLENLNEEDFYFIFFDGTRMPNNPHYISITMFNDTFYIENEKEEKENNKDMYFINKVKKMIEDNLDNIEKMLVNKGASIKSSSNHEFNLKINNKTYRINRNECNKEGQKLFEDFTLKLYGLLYIYESSNNNNALNNITNKLKKEQNENLLNEINTWKQNKNIENFKKMIEEIKGYTFYCPIKENNNRKSVAIILNSKNERLVTAFTSMIELKKWIKEDNINVDRIKFNNYVNILLTEDYKIDGLVIDPFGVNLVLDKKIIKDITKIK